MIEAESERFAVTKSDHDHDLKMGEGSVVEFDSGVGVTVNELTHRISLLRSFCPDYAPNRGER